MKVAVIGGGISGISCANMLSEDHKVTVFEASEKAGGLVKCDRVQDNLYHRVGGHVFNAKDPAVHDWFWSFFDQEKEFRKAKRNAKIWIQDRHVGYPIEDHLFQMKPATVEAVVQDLLMLKQGEPSNFEEFLLQRFGITLYHLYFKPYNEKIWKKDLKTIPLDWLEGKLPMPEVKDILIHNILRKEEENMVHSTFYYAKEGGSQFIIDRLAQNLDIVCNCKATKFEQKGGKWKINGEYEGFDAVVFTGDVRKITEFFPIAQAEAQAVADLPSNGTSSVFCECDPTDISWLYLPSPTLKAHRIINTGTFSPSNNRGTERMTCVVEFSGHYEKEEMLEELTKLPGNLKALDFNHEPNSYIVQAPGTREKIDALKDKTEAENVYLLGRFGEWEYYNMDKAMEAAMKVRDKINA